MDLLYKTWLEIWTSIRAKGTCLNIFDEIRSLYQIPIRSYHTFEGHISHCIKESEQIRHITENHLALNTALMLHDIIQDPERNDNKNQSMNYASYLLKRIGAKDDFIDIVNLLITCTNHFHPPASYFTSGDSQFIRDIDLSIFGQDWFTFYEFEEGIRKEYNYVPYNSYKKLRSDVLQIFLNRKRIYLSEYFHTKYDRRARRNLTKLIEMLSR